MSQAGIAQFNSFLRRANESVGRQAKLHVVMGNDGCDLDSMVSSLSLAYLRDLQSGSKEAVVPLMNVERKDFSLRTETVWLFNQLSIDLNAVVFLDEIDLNTLMRRGLAVTLVDHNKLAPQQELLGAAVTEIVDHHHDDKLYTDTVTRRKIETVGSCATLVAEEILESPLAGEILVPPVAKLLLAPILEDTYNLDPEAKKATPKDHKVVAELLKRCPDIDRASFFETLHKEKTSVESLSSYDLLRKDYKAFTLGGHAVGTSSLPCSISSWASRSSLVPDIRSFAAQRHLDFLLINTIFSPNAGSFQRELALYKAPHVPPALGQRLRHHLEKSELALVSVDLDTVRPGTSALLQPDEALLLYSQRNLAASRKQLVPIVSSFFSAL